MKVLRNSPLSRKVYFTLLIIVVLSLGLVSLLVFYQLFNVRKTLETSHKLVQEQTVSTSSEISNKQAVDQLRASTTAGAELCDEIFKAFKRSVLILSSEAETLYDDQDKYGPVTVLRPDAANAGELKVQLLYSEKADQEDPAIIRETELLGNMSGTLTAVHENYEPIVADCIATETGIMIMADMISDTKFDENGGYLPYEANTRPWYIGVKASGELFFTKLSRDAHTSRTGIMCGAPVYHDGKLVAVVEAGMYLDNLEEAVKNAAKEQSDQATISIVNEDGELVASTAKEGVLAIDFENLYDLRTQANGALGEFLTDAIDGGSEARVIDINGESCYAVSAPLETVGWTYVITIPEKEVNKVTEQLAAELSDIGAKATEQTNSIMRKTILYLLITAFFVLVLVSIISVVMSQRLVKPITLLTKEIQSIDGDDLDFSWKGGTNDEIEVLGKSFESMTVRMKTYIEQVTKITAEKERLGAELDVATRIQADMLPSIFPAFPEREDIDIFAAMEPAKEVGGDFYDMFMVDDDHLAMVMADVSGKGVPAALFMVIAKTLIKNNMQAKNTVEQSFINANNQLAENNDEGYFVTAWVGLIDLRTGQVEFSDAGHETAFLIHNDGSLSEINPAEKIIPLAALEGMVYLRDEFKMERGEKLFLYTDGVPEATNSSGELFGMERLCDSLKAHSKEDPDSIVKSVRADVDEFVGEADQFDDITMLAFEFK
mgnify:CR=1 FL=1